MAEGLPIVVQPGIEDVEDIQDMVEDESDSSNHELEEKVCAKLKLPDNIAAYIKKQKLLRETETIKCDHDLVQKVILNYIIVKKILGNLCWQEKMLCKLVCSTWHSAVHALQKEQISAVDFMMDVQRNTNINKFEKSSNFYNEPMAVLAFANTRGFNMTTYCDDIDPCPCRPPCPHNEHYLIDVLHHQMTAPKNCMLTSVTNYLSYMPLPQSVTAPQTITRHNMFMLRSHPIICGVYIPVLPAVKFHVIHMQNVQGNNIDMQKDFFDVIDKLAQTRIIKGVIVYVTEKFLLHSVEDIVFLDYLKKVQPDIPYALGGCIVEETLFEESNINVMIEKSNDDFDFVSENFISIAMFTVPKNTDGRPEENYNFDMYSLVIDSSEWSKPNIEQTINEFGRKVPHYENSVALKLSCVGRDQKHDVEQDFFRVAFPQTPIVGCYGNGELGINHPARPSDDAPSRSVKRHKRDPGQQGLMYSYSTVFMYLGWGRVRSPAVSKV